MPLGLHGLAEEDEADDDERHGEVDDAQADLGFEMPLVRADVLIGVGVVQPVADDLAEDDGDDGGEVEEADLLGAEAVEGGHEDGEGGVDADGPGEGEGVEEARDEDGGLEDHRDGAPAGLGEGVAQVAGFELGGAEEAGGARAGRGLGGGGDGAVVVGFLEEEGDEEQREDVHGEVHPEGDGPGLGGEHERGEEGPGVGRDDDEGGPDVDLARALVEEEDVLDEHEAAGLRDGRGEAVEDARGREGVEAGGAGAPGGRGGRAEEEPEHDGQPAKVRTEEDHHDTAGAEHEDVAGLGVVDVIGGGVPLAGVVSCKLE